MRVITAYKWMQNHSIAAVSTRLVVDPDPSATSVVVVKVSPKVPPSLFGLGPVPQRPAFLGSLVHEGHVVALAEFCELRVAAEIALAEIVANRVRSDVGPSDWQGDRENSPGPAIVVASIQNCEGSVLGLDVVEGPSECLLGGNAENG